MGSRRFSYDVVTIGGATQDITYHSEESLVIKNPDKKNLQVQKLLAFEYGTKIYMRDILVGYGGGACNASFSFAHLGLRVGTMLRVGKDNVGGQIVKTLAEEKVATKLIQLDREKYSGFSFVIASAKEKGHTIFSHRGANANLEITRSLIKKIKTKYFYISSWSQKNWKKDFETLLAGKKLAKVAWNPGALQLAAGKSGLAKFLPSVDVFNVNKDEAIELVVADKAIKNSKTSLNNARTLLKIMSSWGLKIIVITDGARGAYAYHENKIYYEKAPKVKLVDTTGAGDAFGSAFITGLIKYDNNIKKALQLGIKNSSSVVQKIGAQEGIIRKGF